MSFITTRGIVFRYLKYAETSVIADFYTEARGLRSFVIAGVRSRRATIKASLLQVMSLIEVVAYDRSDVTLHRLKEIRLAHTYKSLPFSVPKGAVGLFMAELCRKTIREEEPNPELFDFLWQSFVFLDATAAPFANIHLWFLASLTGYLGFLPHGEWSEKTPFFDLKTGCFAAEAPLHLSYTTPEISSLLHQLLHTELENCHTIKMGRAERKLLLEKMLVFYSEHIDNFSTLQSHLILQEVLE